MNPLRWRWVHWALGLGGDEVPADAEVRLSWSNWPASWRVFVVLFAAAALCYAIVWLYRRDADRLTAPARRLLAGLRLAAMLCLLLAALGPSLIATQRRQLEPVVVLLRDSSQSMSIADRAESPSQQDVVAQAIGGSPTAVASKPPTRAEIVNGLVSREPSPWLAELEQRGQLRVFDFAEDIQPVEVREAFKDKGGNVPSALPPIAPRGAGTNLHQAIGEALSERLTSAVVVITDGQHTDRSTGPDDLAALARRARAQGAPLLLLGLGDPRPPRNVQVAEVYADAQVWKDDPFELQALLRNEGFGGEAIRVELVERQIPEEGDQPASEQVLETRDVTLPVDVSQLRLGFSHTPRATGRFEYTVRVAPLTGESILNDNQPVAPAEVKVIDERAKVLLVAGQAHWDYRFVRQVLEREQSIELSCWLQTLDPNRAQEGDLPITHLPRTKEELFIYDVVLLMDPDPREFDDGWITLLTEFVSEHAGGLIFMAGPSFTSRFVTSPATQTITSLLPVKLGDVAANDVSGILETHDREWPVAVIDAAIDHPVLRFAPESQQSLDAWKLLPGIVWSFPVASATPTSTVLLEHSDPALSQLAGPRPLLVSGQYGAGRTLFFSFEGTWRWRQAGRNAEYFNRFWLQTTRHLMEGRTVAGKRRGTIETDRTRYEIGDRITVVARLTDAAFKPLDQPDVPILLESPGQAPVRIPLRAVPQQPGRFEATLTAQQLGRQTIRVDFGETEAARVETTISVAPPSAETKRTWQDQRLLMDLAAASGGRYFDLEHAAELPAAIPYQPQTLTVQGKPIPLWDTNRFLLLIVGLLTAEWALRKRFKLV